MSVSSDPNAVVGVTAIPHGVELECRRGAVRLERLADGVVRVRVRRSGEWRAPAGWDVLAVTAAVATDSPPVVDDGEHVVLQAGQLRADVDRTSCRVTFADLAGAIFAADDESGVGWDGQHISVRKHLDPDERHYGCGERASRLDHTWETKTFWNANAREYDAASDEMYCSIPFLLALRPALTFGCFVNSSSWTRISAPSGAAAWTIETTGPELDYVIIHGSDPAEVLRRFTALTGRMELPPLWAVGYHQSHWGYDSAEKVRRVAAEFERRQLPCDVLHFDIGYMDRHQVFTWHPQRFPDPPGLLDELRQGGRRVVAIVDPGVKEDPRNAVFTDGVERDSFIRNARGQLVGGQVWPGRCVFPDFLRDDVREWWSGLHATLTDVGVAGIWNDMNEPAIYDHPVDGEMTATAIELPADACQGPPERRVAHDEVHNLYGLGMARGASEALTRLRPDERSFALTRSGFAGIQRYSAVWTGDNTSSWEHLQLSLTMLCNLGLSGVPFVGADIGGFWGDASPELFARWIQTGVLYPLMRAHSHKESRPNEPWAFGPEVEEVARQALALRYRLRPYLYTLFHEAATTGSPVLRPMLWEFAADDRAVRAEDQVMLGAALLGAPVCQAGARQRSVYLPAGRWYDWWTGAPHDGGRDIIVDAPLERLPLFGRAGHAVPIAPAPGTLSLRVFPGAGTGRIYEDDGESFRYRHGAFAIRHYELSDGDSSVTVQISAADGSFRPARRTLRIELPDGRHTELGDDGSAMRAVIPR